LGLSGLDTDYSTVHWRHWRTDNKTQPSIYYQETCPRTQITDKRQAAINDTLGSSTMNSHRGSGSGIGGGGGSNANSARSMLSSSSSVHWSSSIQLPSNSQHSSGGGERGSMTNTIMDDEPGHGAGAGAAGAHHQHRRSSLDADASLMDSGSLAAGGTGGDSNNNITTPSPMLHNLNKLLAESANRQMIQNRKTAATKLNLNMSNMLGNSEADDDNMNNNNNMNNNALISSDVTEQVLDLSQLLEAADADVTAYREQLEQYRVQQLKLKRKQETRVQEQESRLQESLLHASAMFGDKDGNDNVNGGSGGGGGKLGSLAASATATTTLTTTTPHIHIPTREEMAQWRHQQTARRLQNEELLQKMASEAPAILRDLNQGVGAGGGGVLALQALDEDTATAAAAGKGMTQTELQRERMHRWQRALELYVLCPESASLSKPSTLPSSAFGNSTSTNTTHTTMTMTKKKGSGDLTMLHLLQILVGHCTKEEELATACTEASGMCTQLVEMTATVVRDATEYAAETEDSYHIHLEAFRAFMYTLQRDAASIEESFQTNGRAALKIGQQLEYAERKRKHCETAAALMKQWWMMEQLAAVEEAGLQNNKKEGAEPIQVVDEINGMIPSSSCQLDPLFTNPKRSLEAAKALKNLRAVARARDSGGTSGNPTSPTSGSGGGAAHAHTPGGASSTTVTAVSNAASGVMNDVHAAVRFNRTTKLIERVSQALESRLLNTFLEIHRQGGTYDFSMAQQPVEKMNVNGQQQKKKQISMPNQDGLLDWIALRELAESLKTFDGGRKLHKKYVQQVISIKFPELLFSFSPPPRRVKPSSLQSQAQSQQQQSQSASSPRRNHKTGGGSGNNLADDGNHESSSSEEEDDPELDLDEARTRLSTLFHRVTEVCTTEFALIAHVFSSPSTDSSSNGNGSGGGGSTSEETVTTTSGGASSSTDTAPYQVTRALLQRIIHDPKCGLQARINELLDGVDRYGDFEGGTKKLDTYVVVHEKAFGLFCLIRDAVESNLMPWLAVQNHNNTNGSSGNANANNNTSNGDNGNGSKDNGATIM
jgi:hypothetical protein